MKRRCSNDTLLIHQLSHQPLSTVTGTYLDHHDKSTTTTTTTSSSTTTPTTKTTPTRRPTSSTYRTNSAKSMSLSSSSVLPLTMSTSTTTTTKGTKKDQRNHKYRNKNRTIPCNHTYHRFLSNKIGLICPITIMIGFIGTILLIYYYYYYYYPDSFWWSKWWMMSNRNPIQLLDHPHLQPQQHTLPEGLYPWTKRTSSFRSNLLQQQQQQHYPSSPLDSFSTPSSSKNTYYNYNYYTPTFRTDLDPTVWEWSLIHIVKTRFMQEQGNFTALGEARLLLFEMFCYPTMIHQSNQQFLWIIKMDPYLHTTIVQELISMIQLHPNKNIYLVASNTNFRINEDFPGGWRDGAEGKDLLQSRVYTGNRTLLEYAIALEQEYIVLETRLDADDGLHIQYMEQIQQSAHQLWQQHGTQLHWMYWCSRRHIEWHWTNPQQLQQQLELDNRPMQKSLQQSMYQYGIVQGIQHSKLCITPGITTGFAKHTREKDVPIFAHHELVQKLIGETNTKEEIEEDQNARIPNYECGMPHRKQCLQFMDAGFPFDAIRSRTPTSAGMMRMNVQMEEIRTEWFANYIFWDVIQQCFHIQRYPMQWLNSYLTQHLKEIAYENLMGQCTTGHSCKDMAKTALEELLQVKPNATTTTTSSLH